VGGRADGLLMSRRVMHVGLVALLLLVGGVTLRNIMWEPPVPITPLDDVRSGVRCLRMGGDPGYCRCLDQVHSARDGADTPQAPLPPLDHPAVRYAARHPHEFPIINWDTLRCVAPPAPSSTA
jgi:hypothetical protein